MKSISMAWEDAEQAAIDREDWRGRVPNVSLTRAELRSKVRAWEYDRISPPLFLAEWCQRRLNRGIVLFCCFFASFAL